jgi:hypothetical protein
MHHLVIDGADTFVSELPKYRDSDSRISILSVITSSRLLEQR